MKIKIKGLLGKETKVNTVGRYHPNNKLNDLTGSEWLFHTKSWVIIDGRPENLYGHPATFPIELAQYYIEYFTKKGDWVMDTFMGIGSSMLAALKLKRKAFGIELNQEFFDAAKDRRKKMNLNGEWKWTCGNALNVEEIWKEAHIPKIKFMITSPPYYAMFKHRGGVESTFKKRIDAGFHDKYSNSPEDLGNMERYEDYMGSLTTIFARAKTVMEDDGYVMVIIQNTRLENGDIIPTAWDLAKRLDEFMRLRQEFIWLQNQKVLGIWGYPSTYVSNVHHSYCLVFQVKGGLWKR